MQFLVIAHDYQDALERRLACRQQHIEIVDDLKNKGHLQHGGALLNGQGQMIGSMLICNFPSENDLKEIWLKHEPYLIGKVWETVEIKPYSIGPSFVEKAIL